MLVRKSDGCYEPFERGKIVRSIMAAGESEAMAYVVAAIIEPSDGMDTFEIRHRVRAELRRLGSPLAEEYGCTFKMTAQPQDGISAGFARMARNDLARLELTDDGVAELFSSSGESHRVHVRAGRVRHKRILLSSSDARSVGLEDGAKVSVRRKPREIPSAYLR